MGKRVAYLDYVKGIGILLMLLQHSISQHNLFRQVMQAFVMPLFFIVGGYIWNLKEQSGKGLELSASHLSKRGKQLGIPYLVGGIVLILFYELLSVLSGTHSIGHNLVRLVTLQGIDSMWFLPVYFFAEILFLLASGIRDLRVFIAVNLLVLAGLVVMVRFEGSPWPFALLEKSLTGFLFMSGGYLCARYRVEKAPFWVFILLSGAGIAVSYGNGFASFAELHLPVLFYLGGMVLSVALIGFCHLMDAIQGACSRLLSLFGRETLFILCSNNLIIEIVRLLDHKCTGDFLLHHGMAGNLLMFLILSLLEFLLIKGWRSLNKKPHVATA